jgi:uncharacterized protein YqhQ
MYVANRASDKITQLTDNVYVCRSGSVIISLRDFIFVFVWPVLLWKLFSLLDFLLNLFCLLGFLLECLLFLIYLQMGYWLQQALFLFLLQAADSQVVSDYVRYFLHQHTWVSWLTKLHDLILMLSYISGWFNNSFSYDLQNSAWTTRNC